MCLAIPLKITEIFGKKAMAEIEGIRKEIRVDFITDLKVGDYVIVHAGFALEKLDDKAAIENMKLIKEVTDAALGRI